MICCRRVGKRLRFGWRIDALPGEETSPDGKTRVRLRLPPVREGPMQQGLPRFLQSKDAG